MKGKIQEMLGCPAPVAFDLVTLRRSRDGSSASAPGRYRGALPWLLSVGFEMQLGTPGGWSRRGASTPRPAPCRWYSPYRDGRVGPWAS
jgi:hypothetical protein